MAIRRFIFLTKKIFLKIIIKRLIDNTRYDLLDIYLM